MKKCPCKSYGVDSCRHAEWIITFERDIPGGTMATRIRVSKETIARNVAENRHVPAVYVNRGSHVTWCHEAVWDGPSRIVHSKNHVWIEVAPDVDVTVILHDEPIACEEVTA